MRPDYRSEVDRRRIWRDRCGEPMPDGFPVRCRRDLDHPEPHVGTRHAPTDYVEWPGRGNSESANHGGGTKCWCQP